MHDPEPNPGETAPQPTPRPAAESAPPVETAVAAPAPPADPAPEATQATPAAATPPTSPAPPPAALDPLAEVKAVIAREAGVGEPGLGEPVRRTVGDLPVVTMASDTPPAEASNTGTPSHAPGAPSQAPGAPSHAPGALIGYPVPAGSGTAPALRATDRDEKVLSAISHASALIGFSFISWAVPFLIYYFWRNRSPYVRFQAAQGLAMHIAFALLMWVGAALIGGLAASIIGIVLIPFAALVLGVGALLMVGYVFIAVLLTLSGDPFEYVWLGPRVREWLEKA